MIRRILAALLSVAMVIAVPFTVRANTIKVSYRATNTAMTITALSTLINSTSQTTGIWGSASVDNTTNLDIDELVTISITTAAASTSATGTYVVYFYGCTGTPGATTCTDAVTGAQGTQSLTNPTNLNKVSACNAVANATQYVCGPFSVANAFGGVVPTAWGVVVQNLTGATFTSSYVHYDSLQLTSN